MDARKELWGAFGGIADLTLAQKAALAETIDVAVLGLRKCGALTHAHRMACAKILGVHVIHDRTVSEIMAMGGGGGGVEGN